MEDDNKIIEEFEGLFGLTEESTDADTDSELEETVTESETETTETETEPTETETETDSETDSETETETAADNKQKQQNHAFAQLRTQVKQQSDLIKQLGEAIGLEKGTDVNTIADKVKEVLLLKQSKDTNIPVEFLKQFDEMKTIINENKTLKLQQDLTNSLNALSEKYALSEEQLLAFTDELIKQGKNPFDGVEVDLESEYLKLHHSEIVQKAVDDALKADKDRRKKADNHAPNTPPGKGGDDDTVEEITTVSDLDKYFDSLAL